MKCNECDRRWENGKIEKIDRNVRDNERDWREENGEKNIYIYDDAEEEAE